jgi:hypothetical protein
MPFCRKCVRRLLEYSKSCTECGTSTTAPLIKKEQKPKKAPSSQLAAAYAPKVITRPVIPSKAPRPIKVTAATKTAKPVIATKPATTAKIFLEAKPSTSPAGASPLHEIKKTNTSTEEDILANPKDYETQTFGFNFKCLHGHFLRAGKLLPISNGKAFCPVCGEALRKPKRRKPHQYGSF